jgi:hypothetical protein
MYFCEFHGTTLDIEVKRNRVTCSINTSLLTDRGFCTTVAKWSEIEHAVCDIFNNVSENRLTAEQYIAAGDLMVTGHYPYYCERLHSDSDDNEGEEDESEDDWDEEQDSEAGYDSEEDWEDCDSEENCASQDDDSKED